MNDAKQTNGPESVSWWVLEEASKHGLDKALRDLWLEACQSEHGVLLRTRNKHDTQVALKALERARPDYLAPTVRADVTEEGNIRLRDWHSPVGRAWISLPEQDRAAFITAILIRSEKAYRRGVQHGALYGHGTTNEAIENWRYNEPVNREIPPPYDQRGPEGAEGLDLLDDWFEEGLKSGKPGLTLRRLLESD